MRTKIPVPLLAPLFLLGTACDERGATAPEDGVFAGDSYDATILDGGNGNVQAINDAGVAVGTGREWEGSGTHPFAALRWVVTSEGVTGPEELPLLDGVSSHQAMAVNSSGEIAGYFQKDNRWGAFRYSDDLGMLALPLFASTDEAFAWDINDSGIVVGSVGSEAVVWVNAQDKPTVLPMPAGYTPTRAWAINSDGLIVGSVHGSDVPLVGLTWVMDHTGQLEGPYQLETGFYPSAVNAEGDIVGIYGECGSALLRGDELILLDPDESCHRPWDITDAAADGTVRIVSGGSWEGAVIWTVDAGGQVRGPVDLPTPEGTTGAYTRAINNQGWIVGAGKGVGDVPALWMPKSAEGDGDGD